MHRDVGKKVLMLRKALGESQEAFGKRFKVKQATVSRWEDNLSPITRALWGEMADLADMSIADFFFSDEGPRIVPVIGEVSAGEHFTPMSDSARAGSNDVVTFGTQLGEEMIAVRVRGDSMSPVYQAGDVVIGRKLYGADMVTAINRDCVVLTTTEEGFLKVLKKGPKKNLFTLQPYNKDYDDVENVTLLWAAPVSWVKRA